MEDDDESLLVPEEPPEEEDTKSSYGAESSCPTIKLLFSVTTSMNMTPLNTSHMPTAKTY